MYNNKLPYSFKYYEDNPIFGRRWFVFGKKDGMVNINDGDEDVFEGIPEKEANELIKARECFIDKIEKINIKLGGNRRMFN